MRLKCKYVSVLDFGEGIGHSEQLIIDEDGVALDIGAGLGDLATVGAGAAG
jgi:hypothetical protein